MGIAYLKGTRVIACTWGWAGSWAGSILADMGAEVIKVESRRKLDNNRWHFKLGATGGVNSGEFNFTNRGTKSITLNMRKPGALKVFKDLVKISDVIITNYTPRVMPSWGLDYDVLKAVKPDIILVSLPGFGSSGPNKDYVAYGPTIQAASGMTFSHGHVGEDPILAGANPADPAGGMWGVLGVVAALNYRDRTGLGQNVDVAQSEGITAYLPELIMEYTMNRTIRPRMGNRDEIMAPHSIYPCKGKDKWVAIAVGTDEEWNALCKVIGKPGLMKDERFADQFSRWQNQDDLDKIISGWTKDFTHYEIMNTLQTAGVAAGASLNVEELINDPHVKERGVYIEQNHPEAGKSIVFRSPWTSALTATNPPAPCLGQHNEYVFKTLLGMSDSEITNLTEEEVIF
jgi:crotonobetainyl-CoA:carnitine CoA-transferase CaiB-like acyl-CoA transferase